MNKTKLLYYIIVIFISLSNFGGIGIGELKLNIIFGVLAFAGLISKSVKPRKEDVFIFMILLLSIFYAFFIDLINGRAVFYILISKIFILSLSLLLLSYFSKLSLPKIEIIFNISNIFSFIINCTVIFCALTPTYKQIVFGFDQYGVRLQGFNDQVNGYALCMIFTFSISLYCLLKKINIITILSIITSIIIIIMIQSRGLISAIILSILFIVPIILYTNKSICKLIKYFTLSVSTIILLIVSLPYILNFLNSNIGLELSRLNENNTTSSSDISINNAQSERVYLYESGLKTLISEPFGIGFVDNHKTIYKHTGIELLPHNFFISLLLNFGIGFGTVWLLLFILPIYMYLKKIRLIGKTIDTSLYILFLMIILQLVVFLFTHSSDYVYLWVYLAMGIGFLRNNTLLIRSII